MMDAFISPTMDTILWGIVGSLVAAALVVGLGRVSTPLRGRLGRVVSRAFRLDCERVYSLKADAARDIQRATSGSRRVQILTGRGNELQRGEFAHLVNAKGADVGRRIELLVPTIDPASDRVDWLSVREAELALFDSAYGSGTLKEQVRATQGFLGRATTTIEIGTHNFPHIGRIIITDEVVFVNTYPASAHGHSASVVRFGSGGPMYEYFAHYFQLLWASRDDIP